MKRLTIYDDTFQSFNQETNENQRRFSSDVIVLVRRRFSLIEDQIRVPVIEHVKSTLWPLRERR